MRTTMHLQARKHAGATVSSLTRITRRRAREPLGEEPPRAKVHSLAPLFFSLSSRERARPRWGRKRARAGGCIRALRSCIEERRFRVLPPGTANFFAPRVSNWTACILYVARRGLESLLLFVCVEFQPVCAALRMVGFDTWGWFFLALWFWGNWKGGDRRGLQRRIICCLEVVTK